MYRKGAKRLPFAVLNNRQIVKMADKLRWKEYIATGRYGWQLRSMTVAACIPSTHKEMVKNSKRLASLLNEELIHTAIPYLHYAKKKGGLNSKYLPGTPCYPGRFGERTRLGNNHTLRCTEHENQYSKCDSECRIGVKIDGEWAYKLVSNKEEL